MKKLSKKQRLIIFIAMIMILVIIGLIVGVNIIRTNIINNSYESSNSDSHNGNLLPEYIKKGITLGGVTGTLEDLDTSDATATPEDIAWGKTAYVNGKKVTGVYISRVGLKVGDYVNYIPDNAEDYYIPTTVSGASSNQTILQDKNLKWRILDINSDGTVDLISDSATTQNISFGGSLGYNNCVFLLNDICAKQYSNSQLGITARSINLEEDIETKMNEEGMEYRRQYHSSANVYYGQTKTYNNIGYPNLCIQENGIGINATTVKTDGINRNESYYTTPTEETYSVSQIIVTQTYYHFFYVDSSEFFDDSEFYDLIFNDSENYWIATRVSDCYEIYTGFSLRNITDGELLYTGLFGSGFGNGGNNEGTNYIRPIVTLSANIQISDGDGSEDDPYELFV